MAETKGLLTEAWRLLMANPGLFAFLLVSDLLLSGGSHLVSGNWAAEGTPIASPSVSFVAAAQTFDPIVGPWQLLAALLIYFLSVLVGVVVLLTLIRRREEPLAGLALRALRQRLSLIATWAVGFGAVVFLAMLATKQAMRWSFAGTNESALAAGLILSSAGLVGFFVPAAISLRPPNDHVLGEAFQDGARNIWSSLRLLLRAVPAFLVLLLLYLVAEAIIHPAPDSALRPAIQILTTLPVDAVLLVAGMRLYERMADVRLKRATAPP